MSKSVILELDGDWETGFRVTLEISTETRFCLCRVKGDLPPNPALLYQAREHWRDFRDLSLPSRISAKGIVVRRSMNARVQVCKVSAEQLRDCLNEWLETASFRAISDRLRTELNIDEEVRFLIRTSDLELQKLPWSEWDLFQRFHRIEPVFSPPELRHPLQLPHARRFSQVKILAILGHGAGMDIERDRQIIEGLPHVETTFLVEPKSSEINQQLWEQEWDIIFFAGHSKTEGETGRIYLNSEERIEESITIDELWYGFKKAVEKGLRLAIFNSCDGLGLARQLSDVPIPQIIVMRERVPDRVAQEFLQHFLAAFAGGQSLYAAVRNAREKLQGIHLPSPSGEFECVGATWLPVVFEHPSVESLTWRSLSGVTTGDTDLTIHRDWRLTSVFSYPSYKIFQECLVSLSFLAVAGGLALITATPEPQKDSEILFSHDASLSQMEGELNFQKETGTGDNIDLNARPTPSTDTDENAPTPAASTGSNSSAAQTSDLLDSFFASTAHNLIFPNGEAFSEVNLNGTPLLTFDVPVILSVHSESDRAGSIVNAGNLAVDVEEKLSLVGGTVVNTGQLVAPLGEVALLAVPEMSAVALGGQGKVLGLSEIAVSGVADATPLNPPSSEGGISGSNGDGGRVIIWADETTGFYGTIRAIGGSEGGNSEFVEVSGKRNLAVGGRGGDITFGANGNVAIAGILNSAGQQRSGDITIASNNGAIAIAPSDTIDAGSLNSTQLPFNVENGGNNRLRANNNIETIPSVLLSASSDGADTEMVITTDRLTIRDGGLISTATSDRGQGGNIEINASDVLLRGTSRDGQIFSSIFARLFSSEPAGSITLKVNGDLRIEDKNIFLTNRGQITAETSSGEGGNISLNAERFVLMRNNNLISTTAGTALAGGNGGHVTINTTGVWGLTFHPQLTPFGDLTASSRFGAPGVVELNTLNIDPSRSWPQLPGNSADAEIAESCSVVDRGRNVEFAYIGRRDVPLIEFERFSSSAITEDWIDLPALNAISRRQGVLSTQPTVQFSCRDRADPPSVQFLTPTR